MLKSIKEWLRYSVSRGRQKKEERTSHARTWRDKSAFKPSLPSFDLWPTNGLISNSLLNGPIKNLYTAIDSLFHKLQFEYKHDIVRTMFEKIDLLTSNSFLKGQIKKLYRAIDSLFHKLQFEYKHDIVWNIFKIWPSLTFDPLMVSRTKTSPWTLLYLCTYRIHWHCYFCDLKFFLFFGLLWFTNLTFWPP